MSVFVAEEKKLQWTIVTPTAFAGNNVPLIVIKFHANQYKRKRRSEKRRFRPLLAP